MEKEKTRCLKRKKPNDIRDRIRIIHVPCPFFIPACNLCRNGSVFPLCGDLFHCFIADSHSALISLPGGKEGLRQNFFSIGNCFFILRKATLPGQ